ncbi:hypothetical protein LguiA_003431 [Lonicera macranthoides]
MIEIYIRLLANEGHHVPPWVRGQQIWTRFLPPPPPSSRCFLPVSEYNFSLVSKKTV